MVGSVPSVYRAETLILVLLVPLLTLMLLQQDVYPIVLWYSRHELQQSIEAIFFLE